jgi:hypothetical protein
MNSDSYLNIREHEESDGSQDGQTGVVSDGDDDDVEARMQQHPSFQRHNSGDDHTLEYDRRLGTYVIKPTFRALSPNAAGASQPRLRMPAFATVDDIITSSSSGSETESDEEEDEDEGALNE